METKDKISSKIKKVIATFSAVTVAGAFFFGISTIDSKSSDKPSEASYQYDSDDLTFIPRIDGGIKATHPLFVTDKISGVSDNPEDYLYPLSSDSRFNLKTLPGIMNIILSEDDAPIFEHIGTHLQIRDYQEIHMRVNNADHVYQFNCNDGSFFYVLTDDHYRINGISLVAFQSDPKSRQRIATELFAVLGCFGFNPKTMDSTLGMIMDDPNVTINLYSKMNNRVYQVTPGLRSMNNGDILIFFDITAVQKH